MAFIGVKHRKRDILFSVVGKLLFGNAIWSFGFLTLDCPLKNIIGYLGDGLGQFIRRNDF